MNSLSKDIKPKEIAIDSHCECFAIAIATHLPIKTAITTHLQIKTA